MATFSERLGLRGLRDTLQINDLDDVTRNRISNLLRTIVGTYHTGSTYLIRSDVRSWIDRVLKESVSSYDARTISTTIEKAVQQEEWYTVLDTVEHFVTSRSNGMPEATKLNSDLLQAAWNRLFEEEGVGYRFYDGEISPILERDQADAIYGASKDSNVSSGARHHIRTALDLLRPGEGGAVDAARVVREAISACEAQARFTLGDDRITLGQATKKIAANKNSHSAFVDGISKLYGWTSDEAGIRHASDGTPVSLNTSDAIFFLTIASAFVTWASRP